MNSQSKSIDSNAESTCLICSEEWTTTSDHRLCCLKCGHLFGRSCIEHWIKEKGNQAKCPTCMKPVKKADLRDLWCTAIKAIDNSELKELQQTLEIERKRYKTDSAVIFQNNLRIELLHKDLEKLRQTLIEKDKRIKKLEGLFTRLNKSGAIKLANEGGGGGGVEGGGGDNFLAELERINPDDDEIRIDVDVNPREMRGLFHLAKKVELSPTGGCKSFTVCPTAAIILVAQPAPPCSSNALFGGFGLRKYSIVDTIPREFIPLHSKTITSIQLKPFGDLILTAGQDKKIKLTSINNNTCIQAYQSQFEPTCVSWSADRDQQFFVGSGNCYVTLYDIRNTSEYIYQTSQRVASTRLLSIASTIGQDSLNGLLVNDTKGTQFLQISEESNYNSETISRDHEHLSSHQLPFAGVMGTVDFHKPTGLSLVTTRRSPTAPNQTHNLIKLKKEIREDGNHGVVCDQFKTFFGGPAELLGQSRILKHPTIGDHVLVGSCDGDARGIRLWDSSDNSQYQAIRTDVFMRDMLMFTHDNSNLHVLFALYDKGLFVYRWDIA